MANDDRILLEQWSKQGDGEAFRTLVSRYGGVVYGACRRILGNPSDAEDIAQECFEALATAGTKPGSYVGAWLHRVATYHAISRVRSDARRKQREMLFHTARPTENTVEWKDIYDYVDEAIDELPEIYRRPLIAHYLEGQSKEVVGQDLGLSRQLASYRIERGLECVRATLQRKGVSLGTALLASLMGANAAEAAPAVLAARLGKIALAGPGITAPVAAAAAVRAASSLAVGASFAKVAGGLAAISLTVAAVLFFGWHELMRPYPAQDITASSTFSESASLPIEKRLTPVSSGESEGESEGEGEGEAPVSAASGGAQILEPGTLVYGVVLDETGRPVPRATVTLDNQESMEEQRARLAISGMPIAAREVNLQQTTNVQGVFAFERVPMKGRPEGGLVLAAQSGDRYAMKTIGAFGASRQLYRELILSPGGKVRGKVIDQKNAGVPGAFVRVIPTLARGETEPLTYITKADGAFESRPLPQGMYELFVTAIGYPEPERPVVRPDGTMNVIRLGQKNAESTGSISGWVVNAADGRRMPGLGVQGVAMPEVTTGADGAFHIEGAPEGTWALGLAKRSEPYALAEPVSVDLKAGQHVTGIELKATRGCSVSGQVLSADTRKPVARASLVFARGKRDFAAQATADENGRFTLERLGPGDYDVRMNPPNYKWRDETTPLSVRGDMENVELLMPPFRAARGTVLNGSGAPVAGASVVVVPLTRFMRLTGITDTSGAFEIPLSEQVDTFYVQAYGDSGASKFAGPFGIESRAELRLEASGAIEGTVADSTGQPVAGAVVGGIPEEDERIIALNADGSSWRPGQDVPGITARTSLSGAFEMEPVFPGRIRLEVYLPSSAKGYPVAETEVTVRAGQTLKTKLVLDLAGYASIEGTVTQGGTPIPFVAVEAYSRAEQWVAAADAQTDANGRYVLSNIRAGEIQITAYGEGRSSKTETIQLAENEARTLDFDFGQHEGGIEGYFTVNGKPGMAFLSAKPAGEEPGGSTSDAITDGQGYYRMANLAPGKYAVQLRNAHSRNEGKVIPSESSVEVTAAEFARCDFTLQTGRVEGAVQGLGQGEKAGVGVFPGTPDPRDLLALPMTSMEEMMATYMVTSESGQFQFDDISPGIYTLAAVALPATADGSEPDLATSLAAGRYVLQPVEIAAGEVTTLDVTLPK